MVSMLLEKGVDVNTSSHGTTALFSACGSHKRMPEGQNLEIIRILLVNGADVNTRGNLGWTPLTYATLNVVDSIDIVKILLLNGAEVNAKGFRGKTALQLAVSQFENYNRWSRESLYDKKKEKNKEIAEFYMDIIVLLLLRNANVPKRYAFLEKLRTEIQSDPEGYSRYTRLSGMSLIQEHKKMDYEVADQNSIREVLLPNDAISNR